MFLINQNQGVFLVALSDQSFLPLDAFFTGFFEVLLCVHFAFLVFHMILLAGLLLVIFYFYFFSIQSELRTCFYPNRKAPPTTPSTLPPTLAPLFPPKPC